MGNFVIRTKITVALRSKSKNPIAEIEFLGCGGAFDPQLGNSACLIKTAFGTILIDCGFYTYPVLVEKNLIQDIKYVFITHTHEDHIGSLSTFLFHKTLVCHQEAKIESSEDVAQSLVKYLSEVCATPSNMLRINTNIGDAYNDINMMVYKINTTGYHQEGLPSGGFVFNFKKGGEDIFIIYSGDINTPITSIIEKNYPELYERLLRDPESVFIFHEATARDYPPYFPHCEFEKLVEQTLPVFHNIFTYHHSGEEYEKMEEYQNESTKQYKEMINKLNVELAEKLEMLETDEEREQLKVMAKVRRDEIINKMNELDSKPRLKSVFVQGSEFQIEEQRGF